MKASKLVSYSLLAFACVSSVWAETGDLLDTCWMWGHETGQVDGPNNQWQLEPATNYYSMVQACKDMGLYNLNVIRWDLPDKSFRDSLKGLKRLTFPISAHPDEKHSTYAELGDYDFAVADEMPNVVGFELDDYMLHPRDRPITYADTPEGRIRVQPTAFPYADLVALRKRRDAYTRPLELRIVFYDMLFEYCEGDTSRLKPFVDLSTVVTYWTWKAKDLPLLRENFARYRKIAPDKPTYLGVYLYDFGDKKEMPMDMMELQLKIGLEMWRKHEIEGFVFLCSSICNRDLPTVAYAKRWIREHGAERRTAKTATGRDAVMFVGAHPDDSEGFAATAFLLREKYDIHLVDLTRGERGLGRQGMLDGTTGKIRVAEEEAACRLLGATPHFLCETNGSCHASARAAAQLEALLGAVRPKAVFCHWPVDTHADHVQCAAVVSAALDALRAKDGWQPQRYYYEVLACQTKNWQPQYSVDVTRTMDSKVAMLRKYACQNPGDELVREKVAQAERRGRERTPACRYAETFTTFDGQPIDGGVLEELPETARVGRFP